MPSPGQAPKPEGQQEELSGMMGYGPQGDMSSGNLLRGASQGERNEDHMIRQNPDMGSHERKQQINE